MAASKKDMKRADLVVPYVAPPPEKSDGGDMASTLASTMPMAAMFTRNKIIGWTSVVFALQTWMSESPDQRKATGTPAYVSVLMALSAIVVTYMPLFMPPPVKTGAPAPAPTAS